MSNSNECIKYKIIFRDNTEYSFEISTERMFCNNLYDNFRYYVNKDLSDVLCCIKDLKEISLP